MLFKAKIKNIPVWEAKKFKGTINCDLLFSKEMAWYIGREFEFEPVTEFREGGYVEIPKWFRCSDKRIQFYYFHESWIDKS